MTSLFLDTSVLAYAVGAAHPQRTPCRAILRAGAAGEVVLHGSVEVVQEALFHRLRKADRADAIADARDFAQLLHLHDFDQSVLTRMLDLVEETDLPGRDAVHAATALENGFTSIVSADRDFDGIHGLTRVDPAEALS